MDDLFIVLFLLMFCLLAWMYIYETRSVLPQWPAPAPAPGPTPPHPSSSTILHTVPLPVAPTPTYGMMLGNCPQTKPANWTTLEQRYTVSGKPQCWFTYCVGSNGLPAPCADDIPSPPPPPSQPPPPPPSSNPSPPPPPTSAPPPQGSLKPLPQNVSLCNAAWSNFQDAHKETEKNAAQYDIVHLDMDRAAADVKKYTGAGKMVFMYMSVGSVENWRADKSQFPEDAVFKTQMKGWDGERWIRVEKWEALKPVMQARMQAMRTKGAMGVEFDNIAIASPVGATEPYGSEAYADVYKPGGDKTRQKAIWTANIAYAQWLASTAHSLGMYAIFKNGGELCAAVETSFDGIIIEEALSLKELDTYGAFMKANKPMWLFEYEKSNFNATKMKAAVAPVASKISMACLNTRKKNPWLFAGGTCKPLTPAI